MKNPPVKVIVCTLLALLAFAGNSILCRLALAGDSIDPASFTVIRLVAGMLVLLIAVTVNTKRRATDSSGSWRAALMLFVYAATFSYGYVSLDTGTGALILFAAVQITMILVSVASGNRLHYSEWLGLLVAFSGFAYLVAPDLSTPSLKGLMLMTLSGAAWGLYTVFGRSSQNPLRDTAYNFLRTSPFVLLLLFLSFQGAHITQQGFWLAALSGAIASGAGYAVWYVALGGLSVTQAAVVQLLVPALAAIGGVTFTNEPITIRLLESSVLVLGGILTVILGRYYFVSKRRGI